jgi:acetyl-CoA C-acetyltransferase
LPLGKSTKFPLSVAHRLGAAPRRAVLDVVGGQSPQQLVSGFSRAIEAGLSDVVLLVGAEAISTIRHYARAEHKPDFSDDPAGQIEDRGFGLTGLVTPALAAHGMGAPSTQYALLENARRAAQGRGREEYAAAMGELLAPFTKVAAKNSFSAAPVQRSADELPTSSGSISALTILGWNTRWRVATTLTKRSSSWRRRVAASTPRWPTCATPKLSRSHRRGRS